MQERMKRSAIVIALTVADLAAFHSYCGVIWQTWARDPWAKAILLALLALWISSSVVMWGHVSNDVCQTLRERDLAPSCSPGLAPGGPRRDGDV